MEDNFSREPEGLGAPVSKPEEKVQPVPAKIPIQKKIPNKGQNRPNLLKVWLNILLHPNQTFESEKNYAKYGETFKHIFAGFALALVLSVGISLGADILGSVTESIWFVFLVFAEVVFFFIVAKIFRGSGSFEQHFYLITLSLIPIILTSIILGSILSLIGNFSFEVAVSLAMVDLMLNVVLVLYSLFLNIKAISVSHGFSMAKAALVVFIPLIIGLVLVFMLTVVAVMLSGSMIAGIPSPIVPMTFCDPSIEVVYMVREASGSPGITKELEFCKLGAEDIIRALAYSRGARLTNKTLAIVCGSGMETGCTDGLYPLDPDTVTLAELDNDPDILAYWGTSSSYAQVTGQIGPVSSDLYELRFRVLCGEHYCRITAFMG